MTQHAAPKPIETRYKGCRFRSRLEARWAVFLDALGVRWHYEVSGLVLPSGHPYLPDFLLPEIGSSGTFIEIKPPLCHVHEWPKHPALDYMDGIDGREFVLLCGEPFPLCYTGFVCGDNNYLWCECAGCGALGIQYDGAANRNCECEPGHGDQGYDVPWRDNEGRWLRSSESPRLIRAYHIARSARFEHGECP